MHYFLHYNLDEEMWPFKKKTTVKEEPKEEIKDEKVIIYTDDSGMRRAEIAMRHAGIAINRTMYTQLLPWIAQVFDEYKKLDYAAGVNTRRRAKKKEDK